MTEQWYVAVDGEQRGPFTADRIQEQVDGGGVSSADLIWREGMPDWVPIKTVNQFKTVSLATPPPIPQRPPEAVPPQIPSKRVHTPIPAYEYPFNLPEFLRKPILSSMHNQRLVYAAGCALTLVSLVFAWGSFSTEDVTIVTRGYEVGWVSWLIALLTLPAGMLAIARNDKLKPLTGKIGTVAVGSSFLASALCAICILSHFKPILGVFVGFEFLFMQPSVGLFLAILATTLMTVGGLNLVAFRERE